MKDAVVEDIYANEIKVLNDAEREIAKRLPKLAARIADASLKEAITLDAEQSRKLQQDLASILARLEVEAAAGAACRGIASLLDEVERVQGGALDPEVRDAELTLGIERIQQYQASGYRAAQAYAKKLGFEKDVALLGEKATNGSPFESMYANELKVLHSAEREVGKRFAKLAAAANANSVKEALNNELTESARNQSALADILSRMSAESAAGSCRGITSILDEVERVLNARLDIEARDAELVLGAERVRQYLTSGYRAVHGYAQKLGLERDAAELASYTKGASYLDRALPGLIGAR